MLFFCTWILGLFLSIVTLLWYNSNDVNSWMVVIKQKKIILQLYGMVYALEFWLKLIIFAKKTFFSLIIIFPENALKMLA